MALDTKQLLAQIDAVLEFYSENDSYMDDTLKGFELATQFNTMAQACIRRIAGPDSAYAEQANAAITSREYPSVKIAVVYGTISALRADVAAGYINSLQELIHADMFSDYLEMAEHLLSENYKDPAAVLAGGTLEGHLRQLCRKHGIDTEKQTHKGTEPKMATELNTDLYKAKVYPVTDCQSVNSWIAIRNKAAHGAYETYKKEHVELFIQGLRYFMKQYPA